MLLKTLIRETDLQYLSKEKKRDVLGGKKLLQKTFIKKIDNFFINKKIGKILEGKVLELTKKNKLNYHNALLISNLCNSKEDFVELNQIRSINIIMRLSPNENIKNLISLYKTKEELIRICRNDHLTHVIVHSNEKNFKELINFSKTKKGLEQICKNKDIRYIVEQGETTGLKELFSICENIIELEKISGNNALKTIIKYGNKDFIYSFKESIKQNKKGLDFYNIYNLDSLKKIKEKERNDNIKKVNEYQEKQLKDINIANFDPKNRTLILYFKDGLNAFSFPMISHIVNKYIYEGKSKIFNKLKFTSRYNDEYPDLMNDFSDIDYFLGNFQKNTSIYANTFYLTHSTVNEEGYDFMKTSFPIIGLANFADKNETNSYNTIRIPESGRFVKINLKFGHTFGKLQEKLLVYPEEIESLNKAGSFEGIFEEIIGSIQELENKMLEEAK